MCKRVSAIFPTPTKTKYGTSNFLANTTCSVTTRMLTVAPNHLKNRLGCRSVTVGTVRGIILHSSEVGYTTYSFLFLTSIFSIYTPSLICMTRQPFHMQQIWMARLVTWQEAMLASISPIEPRENWPFLATFNAIASIIPCNAAMVSAPDNPWMTSKSTSNVIVQSCGGTYITALFRTVEAMVKGAWFKHIQL